MTKIKIKHFGPIKEGFDQNGGYMDINDVTVFIGNQGSGKSTVAKLISTFSWIEKALVRGDYDIKWFTRKNRLKNQYLTYHRIENYFIEKDGKEVSELDYVGEAFRIHYKNGELSITAQGKSGYPLPQVLYVPSERNFVANVSTAGKVKQTSDSLIEFVYEFDRAKDKIKGGLSLPINEATIEYNKQHDIVYLKGADYRIRLTEASSGFQSLVPLYLVSWSLAHSVKKQSQNKESMSSEELERFRKGVSEIWSNESLSEEQRRIALSELSGKFNKTAFINIVEEPEQNLFPESQWEMLKGLLEFNNMSLNNNLIITTHSPYIIAYLNIAMQAKQLLKKVKDKGNRTRLFDIIRETAMVSHNKVAVYQLDEKGGSVKILPTDYGVTTDQNFLNRSLAQSNYRFDELLEIEQGL